MVGRMTIEHNLAAEARELADQVVGWRRHLHEHPELSFEEHESARFVLGELGGLPDVELSQPTATSVVARIVRGDGPVVALRSELDALPIHEDENAPVRSGVDGVMHACGHDAHTAVLLGVAHLLAREPARFAGEVRLIFQHAEEKPPGGARELAAAGVLDGVDAIVGCHLLSSLPTGQVSIAPGPFMAGNDELFVTVHGRGGHGAMPHEAVDPVPIAAEIVTAINGFVARRIDAMAQLVVSVTHLHASGGATNVIPESAELSGTIRSFDPEVRRETHEALERIVAGIASAHGATHELTIVPGYEPVVNDGALAVRVEEIVRETLGDDVVFRKPPSMGSEDIGALFVDTPGVFFWLGTRNEEIGACFPHHHPRFAIDEASLPVGLELMTTIALRLLA